MDADRKRRLRPSRPAVPAYQPQHIARYHATVTAVNRTGPVITVTMPHGSLDVTVYNGALPVVGTVVTVLVVDSAPEILAGPANGVTAVS